MHSTHHIVIFSPVFFSMDSKYIDENPLRVFMTKIDPKPSTVSTKLQHDQYNSLGESLHYQIIIIIIIIIRINQLQCIPNSICILCIV